MGVSGAAAWSQRLLCPLSHGVGDVAVHLIDRLHQIIAQAEIGGGQYGGDLVEAGDADDGGCHKIMLLGPCGGQGDGVYSGFVGQGHIARGGGQAAVVDKAFGHLALAFAQ